MFSCIFGVLKWGHCIAGRDHTEQLLARLARHPAVLLHHRVHHLPQCEYQQSAAAPHLTAAGHRQGGGRGQQAAVPRVRRRGERLPLRRVLVRGVQGILQEDDTR